MKKVFTLLAIAATFAACNSNPDLDTKKDVVLTDTTSMYRSNASTDVSNVAPQQQAQQVAPARTIIRERTVYVNRTPRTRTVRQADPVEPVVATVPQTQTQPQTSASPATIQSSGAGTSASTGEGNTIPDEKPVVAQKKGWNNSTKDAVIGGVGGAIAGAVLSKNKVKGAVIGGVLGGVGGYIFGKNKDKKDAANSTQTPVYRNVSNYVIN